MSNPTFQVGDRVRRKAGAPNRGHLVGASPFEVLRMAGEFIVDKNGQQHHPDNLALVETHTDPALPPVEGYADPKHEALIRQVTDLQAVIRRRNQEIEELTEQVQLANSYASALSEAGVASWVDGIIVVELGARVRALGVTFDDVRRWYEQEQSEENRVLRRIAAREQKGGRS